MPGITIFLLLVFTYFALQFPFHKVHIHRALAFGGDLSAESTVKPVFYQFIGEL